MPFHSWLLTTDRNGPVPSNFWHQTVQPLTVDGTAKTEYLLVEPWLLPQAVSPQLMQAAIDLRLATLPDETDERVVARSRSQIGFMLTCLNRANEAIQLLKECAHAQQSLEDFRGLVATELRMAQALQACNQVTAAVEVGQAALARSHADPALVDLQHFAHHHLGKAMMHAGLHDQARQHLSAALDLRQKSSDGELVSSTQAALSRLHSLTTNTDA